jgi:hypothetical protein
MATIAWKDNIIVIGGEDKNGNILNTVVSYNVTVKNIKMLPAMNQKRRECTAVLSGNVIVVMGGWTGSEITNSAEYFDFATNMWVDGVERLVLPNLLLPRGQLTLSCSGNVLDR